jgi:hypothetical protein
MVRDAVRSLMLSVDKSNRKQAFQRGTRELVSPHDGSCPSWSGLLTAGGLMGKEKGTGILYYHSAWPKMASATYT